MAFPPPFEKTDNINCGICIEEEKNLTLRDDHRVSFMGKFHCLASYLC